MFKKVVLLVILLGCISPFGNAQSSSLEKVNSWMERSKHRLSTDSFVILNQEEQKDPIKDQTPKAVEFNEKRALSVSEERWSQGLVSTLVSSSSLKSQKAFSQTSFSFPDTFVEKDYESAETEPNYSVVRVALQEDGKFAITNFWGLSSYDVIAVANMTTGAVSIAPQKIYDHSTYGPIFIYPVDFDKRTYSTTDSIRGYLQADGSVKLNNWGIFVATGDYEGSSFGAYIYSVFTPTNATITNEQKDGTTKTYSALLEQLAENVVRIVNFADNGAAVDMILNSDNSLRIYPQYIFTNTMYGEFYCYPAAWATSSLAKDGPIKGTGTATSLTFGNWGVFGRSNPTLYALQVLSTSISFVPGTITYPQPLAASFAGSGSESDPYQVSMPVHLQLLSQQVENGISYTDKYFKMSGDIDCSTLTSRFIPIGNSEDAAFNGVFDGNGKTIQGLNIIAGDIDNVGLFGFVDSTGVVRNLNLTACSLLSSGENAGAIAGTCYGSIENCTVKGSVTVKNIIAGGVVGYTTGKVLDCSFEGTIRGYGDVGGVVGLSENIISRCHALGAVVMNGYASSFYRAVGGVVAEQNGSKAKACYVSDSYFMGEISDIGGYGYIGGVLGEGIGSSMMRCFNVGAISTVATETKGGTAGGVVGVAYGLEASDCYNAGFMLIPYSAPRVGGVVGWILSPSNDAYNSSFTSMYNSATVLTGDETGTAPVFGVSYATDIFHNVYFDRQVNLFNYTGGMATADMTTGVGLTGFDGENTWVFTAGFYPRLKGLETLTAAYLSAAPLTLADGETVAKVKHNFNISTANGISWKIYDNGNFVDDSKGMSIEGNEVKLKMVYSTEMLCAFTPDKQFQKIYSLDLVPPYAFEGEGTEASPYLIKSKADLIALNEATTVYGQTYEGDYFRMTNDIDLEYADDFKGIAAIGKATAAFGGVFDGAGYSIRRFRQNGVNYDENGKAVSSGSTLYIGFFGYCTQSSIIRNLTMAADCELTYWGYSGAIVGSTDGRIENCKNFAPVSSASSYIGGIAGRVTETGLITGCYNAGKVLCGNSYGAGIVGYNQGVTELCQNDGEIAADYFNDFIAAGKQSYAGGICGVNYGTVTRSLNTGRISGYKDVGGVVANCMKNYGGKVTYCLNYGLVECLKDDDGRGGVIGSVSSSELIANNYYDMQINVNGGADNVKKPGITGLTTATLISGILPDSLDAADWSVAVGSYPVLKLFAEQPAAVVARKIYIDFDPAESRADVKTKATLSAFDGLKWTLKGSDAFHIADAQLQVTLPTGTTIACDTLLAEVAGYKKAFPLTSVPHLFKGVGTAADPYLIETTEDMTKLADFITETKAEFNGSYFRLVNDLDYTEKQFTPIAVGNTKFQASFDGNGKTIRSIAYSALTTTDSYIGLFGNIGENGSLRNLTLENSTIETYSYTAGFVGRIYGVIDGCVNKAAITSGKSSYVAGIAGMAYTGAQILNSSNLGVITSKISYAAGIVSYLYPGALVSNCFNTGDILPATGYSAGIAATSGGKIVDCYNKGNITGKQYMGGIVANSIANDTIINCYNQGEVSASSGTVGGIVGTATTKVSTLIDNCYNEAAISGAGYVGGIVGKAQTGTVITRCYNTGDITSSKADCGGIAGDFSGGTAFETKMTDCHNLGLISGEGNYYGGVSGAIGSDVYLENCYNKGDVITTGNFVGGFSGSLSSTTIGCYNTGDVESAGYGIGGFSGIGSGEVSHSFNTGNVTSTTGTGNSGRYATVGGFWGYGRPVLSYCYNAGTLTAPNYVGGIIGIPFSGLVMTNCYNSGRIIVPDGAVMGSIVMPFGDLDVTAQDIHFDSSVNPQASSTDALGKGLTTAEMTTLDKGAGYLNLTATYPVLARHADNVIANFHAAIALPKEGDSWSHITGDIQIGTPEGVSWSASSNLLINGNIVKPATIGEGTLTATAGDLVKTYDLNVVSATSLSDISVQKAIVNRIYYDINGTELTTQPTLPGVYLVSVLYEDGSKEVRKILVK